MAKILKKRLFDIEITGYKKLLVMAYDSKEAEDIVADYLNDIQDKESVLDSEGEINRKGIDKIISMKLVYTPVIY